MRRQVGFGIAVSACGALALAGCGAAPSVTASQQSVPLQSLTPVAAVARMAETAKSLRSASYEFRMSGPLGSTFTGHGSYSSAPKLSLDMAFDSASIGGASAVAGSMKGFEERIVDNTLYLQLPNLPGMALVTGGKKWLKVSLDDAANGSGVDLGTLMSQAAQADPSKQLQTLISAPNVHEVGKEQVDGVATTHYAGDLTAADITRNPAYDARTRDELSRLYAQSGVGSTHLDVWIDQDFRARKFISTTPSAAGPVAVSMTFADYDKPISVAVPDPETVTDLGATPGGEISQHSSGSGTTA